MKFLHKQYAAKKKEIIEVRIDRSTKVKFMTASEFKKYKMHKTHSYYGGTFDRGVVRLVLPFDSVWNVVIEKGTHSSPLAVVGSCSHKAPDRQTLSTIALDAPDHVRNGMLLDEGEAEAISNSSRNEG